MLAVVGLGVLTVICAGAVLFYIFSANSPDLQALTRTVTQFTAQPLLNHIAFVGNDENVWLVGPDGQDLRQVTTDARGYRFPTWSPDGRYLAFVGPNNEDETVLYAALTGQSMPAILYNQADSAPFYLYWSPDSTTITFLTQEAEGLAMRQVQADTPGSDRVLAEGNPFYWVWSPHSDKLLMHVGGSRTFSEQAHLSLLDNKAGAERVQLDLAPGRFQAPYWSSDGQYFFYIAEAEDGQEGIYKTAANSLEQQLMTPLEGFTYLTLAPNGQHLAYIEVDGNARPPFGAAYLLDAEGKQKKQLVDNPVGSIYWSPDSSKLALLTLARRDDDSTAKVGGLAAPLPQEIFVRWLIYDVKTDTVEALASFAPTLAFLQTVPYFDQYHLSLTFWSPDSRYLVYTEEEDEATGAGKVWVADTTRQEEPRQVGEGTLAVWSWK
jgi:Tol biopolymer transport system component